MKKIISVIFLFAIITAVYSVTIARLKYDGGGDWYNNPSVIPNIAAYFNENVEPLFEEDEKVVTLKSPQLSQHPILYMTGHGNVGFSGIELENLRNYLKLGGFLLIDDDYGMDKSIRPIISGLFREHKLQRLSVANPLLRSVFSFDRIPKIHKHDDKSPEMYGIYINGRLALLYLYETNISDGWASPGVHESDDEHTREQALRFGANILFHVVTGL